MRKMLLFLGAITFLSSCSPNSKCIQ
ncbi:lipoprotein [Capnocytophaga granulosa]